MRSCPYWKCAFASTSDDMYWKRDDGRVRGRCALVEKNAGDRSVYLEVHRAEWFETSVPDPWYEDGSHLVDPKCVFLSCDKIEGSREREERFPEDTVADVEEIR